VEPLRSLFLRGLLAAVHTARVRTPAL
jgi:hypothetical protein